MKLLLAQLNMIPGDVKHNLAKALDALEQGRRRDVDLIVYPELTFAGFPVKDLLMFPAFLDKCDEALAQFKSARKGGPAVVLGHPERHDEPGHGLHNVAILLHDGGEEKYVKCLLPTYDVHDERRYFDAGDEPHVAVLGTHRIGFTVCEDIWNEGTFWEKCLYRCNPVENSWGAGATIVVNVSAAPYAAGKRATRRAMIQHSARTHRMHFVMVNLVGGNDELIYDGSSMVVAPDGSILAEAPPFEEALIEVDLDAHPTRPAEGISELEELRRALVLGLRDYTRKSGIRDVLIGLSGGIDSALVAVLAVQALGPEHVHGISMPSRFSSGHSRSDAAELARNLGIRFTTIPIEAMFETGLRELGPHLGADPRLATENMQARLRGLTLMSLSNASGAMVLTTGNKSEIAVGYSTLYGDMCGGLAVIGDVLKTRVYDLARHLNSITPVIPESTMTKAPSAELAPGQMDTDSLPPYEVLDPIITAHMEENLSAAELVARGHDAVTVARVLALIRNSEYKRRQGAPILRVTARAFGAGWQMPLAKGRFTL